MKIKLNSIKKSGVKIKIKTPSPKKGTKYA